MTGDSTNVPIGVLTNNAIVVESATGTFEFQCRSGSLLFDPVPEFIGLDGNTHCSNTGGLEVQCDPDPGFQPSVLLVRNRVTPLISEEEGVYTCHMYDENQEMVEVNVGLYRNGFNSE